MTYALYVVLVLFGLGAGFFLGCGNYGGVLRAIIPGLVTGLLIAIPSLHYDWTSAGVVILCALVGSIIASQVSDSNPVKIRLREQKNLKIRCGRYRLGSD